MNLVESGAQLDRENPVSSVPVLVWDWPVRVFHWLLVLFVTVAAVSGYFLPANWLNLHLIAGTAIGCLILMRIVWGFFGTRYSRFRSFVFSPAITIAHVKDLFHGRVHREAGHNPLGALMVFALLFCLIVITLSGALALGGQFKQGPFKTFMSFADGMALRQFHEAGSGILMALIGAHLAGVVFESWRSHENLALAMVTGKKRGGFGRDVAWVKARRGVALAVVTLLIVPLVPATYALTEMTPRGVGPVPTNAAWQAECSACHMAFHPSLLPAASWAAIMANLADHFGEDASLDVVKTKEIAEFLTSHSAETSDSLPANRSRKVDAVRPLEITATAFWTRAHRDISPAVFMAKPIGAKQNCSACHADAASGMFAPQSVSIPKETAR